MKRIQDIVLAHEEVQGIHDMMVHDYGPGRRLVSLHAEVPGDYDIFQIHDVIDHIERELNEKLSCEAVIHMDPIETNNEEVAKMKRIMEEKVKEIDAQMTIHDFRMVSGPTHTNLIFDAVMPYELKMSKNEVRQEIERIVENLEGNYFAVVQIDQSYV